MWCMGRDACDWGGGGWWVGGGGGWGFFLQAEDGIRGRLVTGVQTVLFRSVKLLFDRRVKAAWRHINGTFLSVLALGILCGLLISANTVLYLRANQFEALMAFFLGLVLASSWLLKNEFEVGQAKNLVALLLGALFTVAMGMISPRIAELSLVYVFFSASLAICAKIGRAW